MRALAVVALAGALAAVTAAAATGPTFPPGAAPAPGGVRAQLSTPGTDDATWFLDVYRARGSGTSTSAKIRGSIDYCLAVSLSRHGGAKRWRGITCGLSAAVAVRVDRHGLRLDCGAGGHVLGGPAEPTPTCGLVAADVQDVTVSGDHGLTAAAQLSDPFRVRVNRDPRILRRAGVDPARVRALPRDFQVRAFLAFLPTPPTPPGERTPLITVTATRPDGSTLTRTIGGDLFPAPPELPPLRPPPAAPQAHLTARGTDGRRWRSAAWRTDQRSVCVNARLGGPGRRLFSMSCHGRRPLVSNLRGGPQAYTGSPGRMRRRTYPVYGVVRAQATALTVIDPHGGRWSAKLSPVFTTIRRGDRAMRVKAFLAAVPGPPPTGPRGLEFETELSNGTTERVGGGPVRGIRHEVDPPRDPEI